MINENVPKGTTILSRCFLTKQKAIVQTLEENIRRVKAL